MPILARLKEFLDASGVPYTVLRHHPTFTAEGVAAAQHVPPQTLAKVVIVEAGEGFAMVVLPAPCKVNLPMVPERDARLANEAEFTRLFPHSQPGAMPPFGNLFGLAVYVDRRLGQHEDIVFQAGTHTQAVRMKYADFERLVRPIVGDYALVHERE